MIKMLSGIFNPCEQPNSVLPVNSPCDFIDNLAGKAGLADIVLKIHRKDEHGMRLFAPSKKYLSKGGVPNTHEMLYGQSSDPASDFYFLTFILDRDHIAHYDLRYPLLEVQLSPQFGKPKIVGRRLYQDKDNTLRPRDLETAEYVRNAMMAKLGKYFAERTGIKPTLWVAREEIPRPNFTTEWAIDDLIRFVESQKQRFRLIDGSTVYIPDFMATERLIQRPIKVDGKVLEIPPNLVVPIELERRAMGYKGIIQIAA